MISSTDLDFNWQSRLPGEDVAKGIGEGTLTYTLPSK